MSLIEPGRKAPAFTLTDQSGTTHRLSDYAGKPVVLYFYPKDDTPGCTKETCDFRDRLPQFKKSKAVVLGLSILDEKSKAKFAKKFDVTFPLLADADHAVAEKYGVWQEKSRYGRKYMGIARTTYLIDGDGKVARRWDNVKVDDHAQEVLKATRELS
jgi:peroxiredoxin Q/BCP